MMSIPPHPYSAVASIPAGLHANINVPMNAGTYNMGGGTVDYEVLQSFMQRNAEGPLISISSFDCDSPLSMAIIVQLRYFTLAC